MKKPVLEKEKQKKWLILAASAAALLALFVVVQVILSSRVQKLQKTPLSEEISSSSGVIIGVGLQSIGETSKEGNLVDIKLDTKNETISAFQIYYLIRDEDEAQILDQNPNQAGIQIRTTDPRFVYIFNSVEFDSKRGGILVALAAYTLNGEKVSDSAVGQIVTSAPGDQLQAKMSLVKDLTKVVLLNGELTEISEIE